MSPFHVVLAEPDDVTALSVCRALRRAAPAVLVTPDEVMLAPLWSFDPAGASRVELASGTVLEAASVLSVFNRVRHVSPPQFAGAAPADAAYAAGEFFALLTAWLDCFGARVVNRPHPGNVAGFAARSPQEDRLRLGADLHASTRARHLGLGAPLAPLRPGAPVRPGGPARHCTGARMLRVLIVDGTASAQLPRGLIGALRSEMTRRRLVCAEAWIEDGAVQPQVVGLDPLPDARGAAEVEMIARHLLALPQALRGAA